MEYLFLLLVGFVCGKTYTEFKIVKTLKDMLESKGIDVEAEIAKLEEKQEKVNSVHKLVVEKHNDMLYLYDRENHDFVCQGKNIDELAELSKKYKNIIGAVVHHDDKVFMFMNGLSKEFTS
jgi:CRISPR/Cas system CMR subunit Cmr4 (Cas7 group RAMP superfamily)